MVDKIQKLNKTPSSISTKVVLNIGLSIGIMISVIAYLLFASPNMTKHEVDSTRSNTNEPLYWVAPMDPNFKRDKPGKSPMGMDLVPVYEDSGADSSPGSVLIDPVTIQNLGVKTATVEKIMPKGTITAPGQVQYAQDAIEHVHSRIEGWIEVLNVRAKGDFIEKDAPLYSIYSPELVNAQEEFVIALRQNNASLINAAMMRLRALAIPQKQIDELKKTRRVSQFVTFLSPVSGYIDALNIQQGFYVTPSMTMMSIASLNKVWVIADVFPADASLLRKGQRAIIKSDDIPGQHFEAELDYIYPTLNSRTRTLQTRFVVNKPNSISEAWLKPSMYTRVEIAYGNPDNNDDFILAVPKQALIRTGKSDRVVLALEEGKYKSINVRIGRRFDEVFEVLAGLYEGDKIVSSAQFLIDSESSISSDFMRMTPVEVTPSANMSAWTQATVNELLVDENMVNITHGPLDAFDMMGMSMNFTLADNIELSQLKVGMDIHIEVIREPGGMFQIKTLHIVSDEEGAH